MWDEVDEYFGGKLLGSDAALQATLAASDAAALPAIAVSPLQGRLLELIARSVRATFSPLPPARARIAAGRLTPAQSTPAT